MKRRILCILLCLCMALTLIPIPVSAAELPDVRRLPTIHEEAVNPLYGDTSPASWVEEEPETPVMKSMASTYLLKGAEEEVQSKVTIDDFSDDPQSIITALQEALEGTEEYISVYYKTQGEIPQSEGDNSPITTFGAGLGFSAVQELQSGMIETWDVFQCATFSDLDGWHLYEFDYVRQQYYPTVASASDVMRSTLVSRDYGKWVYFRTIGKQVGYNELFSEAIKHTGNPVEGDYLRWQWWQRGAETHAYQVGDYYYSRIYFATTYYTTAAQELEMDSFVETFMARDDMKAARTDYEKVKVIYDWLCANIVYDHEHAGDSSYKPQFTAYAAVTSGVCVCQGYALLFYRLALTCGIDARLIAGYAYGNQENGHAWNAVRLGNNYYLMDSTWDSQRQPENYSYFCRGSDFFGQEHTPYGETYSMYDPEANYAYLGVSTTAYVVPLYSDLTGDGTVDPGDMQALYEYLCRGSVTIAYQANDRDFLVFCDCNNDGEINILDYQALYDMILSTK